MDKCIRFFLKTALLVCYPDVLPPSPEDCVVQDVDSAGPRKEHTLLRCDTAVCSPTAYMTVPLPAAQLILPAEVKTLVAERLSRC